MLWFAAAFWVSSLNAELNGGNKFVHLRMLKVVPGLLPRQQPPPSNPDQGKQRILDALDSGIKLCEDNIRKLKDVKGSEELLAFWVRELEFWKRLKQVFDGNKSVLPCFPAGEATQQISLSSLTKIPSWLRSLKPRSDGDEARQSTLQTLDYLIKDAEETVADLTKMGGNKQLIEDYRKEIAELYALRKKLQNK